jgi:hypothetical protein
MTPFQLNQSLQEIEFLVYNEKNPLNSEVFDTLRNLITEYFLPLSKKDLNWIKKYCRNNFGTVTLNKLNHDQLWILVKDLRHIVSTQLPK